MPGKPDQPRQPASRSASLALLRRMEWRARKSMESALSGEYKSSFRGKGMEFDQVVKYEYGDDVRDIDWNVTARLGEPFRKKFVEEREITLLLLFEDTPSLQFGSGAKTKRETLLELASLLMLLSAVNRDRISLMYASPEGSRYAPAANGRGRILHAAAGLMARPAPDPLGPQGAQIPWRRLAKAAPRHSIFVWLGDFPPQPPPEAWKVLRKRYQPIGFRVDDPWERALPRTRQPVFDPLSGALFTLDGRSSAQQAAHERWRRERDEAFASLFPQPADRLALACDEDALEGIVGLFRERMRRYARL